MLRQGTALQGDSQTEIDVTVGGLSLTGSDFQADIHGARLSGSISCYEVPGERVLEVWLSGAGHEFRQPLVKTWERSGVAPAAEGRVLSPMPGRVTKVLIFQYIAGQPMLASVARLCQRFSLASVYLRSPPLLYYAKLLKSQTVSYAGFPVKSGIPAP